MNSIKIEDDSNPNNKPTTVFNNMRAFLRYLEHDLKYLTTEQVEQVEYLIDRNDVNMGAVLEVYSLTEDVEDFTHSVIIALRKNNLIDKADIDPVDYL